jgi:hypothetical protein
MRGSDFDERAFFGAIAASGVRVLLIGRRALVVLGLPVLTADYDFWLAADDIQRFNDIAQQFDLIPSAPPDAARSRGRYVLENDEHIDVLVAQSIPTVDGDPVEFEIVWPHRQDIHLADGVVVSVPSIDDLIRTKKIGGRPKDLEDIRLLEILRSGAQP